MTLPATRATLGWLVFACAFVAFSAGCRHAATIVYPTDGNYATSTSPITVRFDPEFKPGTFQANLSGTNITSLFTPPPAPGQTSTAEFAYKPYFMDAEYDNNQQRLVVDAEFTSPTSGPGERMTRDSSNFYPPIVRIYRGRTSTDTVLTLKEREIIIASAFVDKAPKEALVVTITGSTLVSLNDQPAGQDIQVVIQPNERRADFNIRGIQVGSEVFVLRGIATGYSSAQSRGVVKPNQ